MGPSLSDVGMFSKLFFGWGGLFEDGFDALFELGPGDQDLVVAAETFDAKIHADAGDFPFEVAAGMGFFQLYYVPDIEFHPCSPSSLVSK